MFFNANIGTVGLQFSNAGLEIATTPSTPKTQITMFFGTFGTSVKLTAYNGATAVFTKTINTANTFQNFTFNTPAPFTRLVFKGGNNEAVLVRICLDQG
jgi:hypothetical protein